MPLPMPVIACHDFESPVPSFDSRAERPDGLLGRSEWKRKGRSVVPKAKRVAEVWDETFGTVPLYSFGQTKPYRPSPRTLAVEAFWDTFVAGHNNGVYIRRKPDEDWKTFGKQDSPLYLHRPDLTKHLSGGVTLGVRGGPKTKWGVIDLDLHQGDKGVFLHQFRTLLSALYGKAGWHYHVGEGGVHLCQTLPRMALVVWRHKMRKTLRELDELHPELAQRAKRSGMKSFGELELYPDPARGVRLPLSAGRSVLTDRALSLVLHRKKQVQDVIGYMAWVNAENKVYMPEAEVVSVVETIVKPRLVLTSLNPKPAKENDLYYKHPPAQLSACFPASASSTALPLKGRFAKALTAFWLGQPSTVPSVHHAVIQTARMLRYELDNAEDAIGLLHEYVEALPALNSESYSDPRKRASQIRSRVQKVYHGDGWLRDVEGSARKLALTAQSWHRRGFFISRKDTWRLLPAADWRFTEEEQAQALRLLPGVLKCEGVTALEAAKRFLGFVSRRPGGYVPMTAIPTILKGLTIAWGKHGKAGRFVAALKGLGWVEHTQHRFVPRGGSGKGEPRRYWIGTALQSNSGWLALNDHYMTGRPTHCKAEVLVEEIPSGNAL